MDAASTSRPVGFVGLGRMGGAIARRLLAGGVALMVFDEDRGAASRLVAEGAVVADTLRALADACPTVFICLPSVDASMSVARALAPGSALRVLVEMSTVGPAGVRTLAELLSATPIEVVDAPVSGGPRGAEAGTLSVMVSGDARAVGSIARYLDAVSSTRFDVGPQAGQAQLCKLINNAISAAGMIAACQATVLGAKCGLDASTMLAAINAGSGRNAATLDKFPAAILDGSFDYGGALGLMLKDLSLYLDQARAFDVPCTMGAAALAEWREAERRTGFHADYSEVIRHLEQDADAYVRSSQHLDRT